VNRHRLQLVTTSDGCVLIYKGVPAEGTLISSANPTGKLGVDAFGNVYPDGYSGLPWDEVKLEFGL
jgi:hypothetical protein